MLVTVSELRVVALLAGGEAVWGLADRGGVLVRFSSLSHLFSSFFLQPARSSATKWIVRAAQQRNCLFAVRVKGKWAWVS